MTATGSLTDAASVNSECPSARLASALGVWQPQLETGSEQQAPVAGFGVGSPQHADAADIVPLGADAFGVGAVLPQQLAALAPAGREGVGVMAISSSRRTGARISNQEMLIRRVARERQKA
jgi:hypothetical protein